jgi:hypothetical protein
LKRDPEAMAAVVDYAMVLAKSRLPDAQVHGSAFGDIEVTGQRFAALAEGIADAPAVMKFLAVHGIVDGAERLMAANLILDELGYREGDDLHVGGPPDISTDLVPQTGVPGTYVMPDDPEAARLSPKWEPGEPPKADRVWPQDWAERRITDVPNGRGPLAATEPPFFPKHYKPTPPADPFGDRSRYPDHPSHKKGR